jgi:hypothetical protein
MGKRALGRRGTVLLVRTSLVVGLIASTTTALALTAPAGDAILASGLEDCVESKLWMNCASG